MYAITPQPLSSNTTLLTPSAPHLPSPLHYVINLPTNSATRMISIMHTHVYIALEMGDQTFPLHIN